MKETASKLAYDIWNASGVSQKKLADKMGLKSQQAVFNMFKAKNGMRVDNFVRMMNVLGYDVVARNKVTDEETVVEAEGNDSE